MLSRGLKQADFCLGPAPFYGVSGLMPRKQPLTTAQPRRRAKALQVAPLASAATLAGLPDKLAPQLAINAAEPPPGDDWISEVKLDGSYLLVWIYRSPSGS